MGHKNKEYVPEKAGGARDGSQKQGICARKSRRSKRWVTKTRNMCPKKPEEQEMGHKNKEYVPEKAGGARVGSQKQGICARKSW